MKIANIKELAKHRGSNVNSLKRDLYNGTECGAWIEWDKKSVTVGAIVENSEAEFDERFDFPFESEAFDEWIKKLEHLCDVAWHEANDTVTWRRVAMVRWGIEYPHCWPVYYNVNGKKVLAYDGEAGIVTRPKWVDTDKELTDDEMEIYDNEKELCEYAGGCSGCPDLKTCSCDWLDEEVPEDKLDEYGLDSDDWEMILNEEREQESKGEEQK